MKNDKSLSTFAAVALAVSTASSVVLHGDALQGGDDPTFTFLLSPQPDVVDVAAAGEFRLEYDLSIRAENDPTQDGAQGWSLSLTSDGVEVADITLDGTVAASIKDDPPGLLDGGFSIAEIGESGFDACEGKIGAISAVVLSFVNPVTLPPEGEVVVARLGVVGRGPGTAGETRAASVYYVDGCGGIG